MFQLRVFGIVKFDFVAPLYTSSKMVLCPILWGINYHIFMPVRLDEISNLIVETCLKFVHVYQKNLAQFTPTFFDNLNYKR